MKLALSKGINYLYVGAGQLRSGVANLFSIRFFIIAFLIALAADIVSWIFAGSLNRSLDGEQAILHYNVIFGIDNVGPASGLYIIPLLGLLLLVANMLIAVLIGDKLQRLLVNLLVGFAALGNLLLLLALYFVYLVNFS